MGEHAQQQGSKVDADWLRFDFTNMTAVGGEELSTIESDVHKKVAASDSIRWDTVGLDEAKKAGAMMLFGEKYPDPVRMVSIGEFSKELCGGTHLTNSSDVGEFEIISEEGVSAGTRRIIALTGKRAKQHMDSTVDELSRTAKLLGVATLQAPAAAEQLVKQVRDLKKQLSTGSKPSSDEPPQLGTVAGDESDYRMVKSALRQSALLLNVAIFEVAGRTESLLAEVESLKQQAEKLAQSGDLSADTLLEHSEKIGETSVVVMEIPGGNSNLMRQLIDQFRKKVGPSAVLLAASQGDDKVVLVAGVSRDLVENGASAGNWVKEVAPVVGGGGGGKPDMAQAGGKNPEKLSEALVKAKEVIQGMLAG